MRANEPGDKTKLDGVEAGADITPDLAVLQSGDNVSELANDTDWLSDNVSELTNNDSRC